MSLFNIDLPPKFKSTEASSEALWGRLEDYLHNLNTSLEDSMTRLFNTLPQEDAGSLGGWIISDAYLYNLRSGTPTSSPSDGVVLASGDEALIIYENTEKRVEVGYLSAGVYGLKVYDDDGSTVLVELSDTQKVISGWNIVDGYIYNLQSGTPTASPNDGIVIAAGNSGIICYENTEKRCEVGYLSAGVYGIKVYDDNGSTVLFETSDTQKLLAGWTISSTTLANGTNIILDASNKAISINDATYGNAGIQLEYNSGTPRIYAGDGSNEYFQYDGTNVSWKGANSELNASGNLICTGGTIGGWTITSTTIASTNITIDSGNEKIESSNYVSGYAGAGFHLSPSLLEVGNIACRGIIRTAVFQKDVVHIIGGNLLVRPADVLNVDMTALDASTLTIEGNETFVAGDNLRIKDGINDEWLTVTNIGSAPTYTVTRDRGSAYGADSNPTWKKGASIGNYGAAADAIGANAVLMLHLDGVDEAQATIDSSPAAHGDADTWVATAQLDTAQKEFGTASLLVDGNSDYIAWNDHADWDLTGDFTVEAQIRFNNTSGSQTIMSVQTDQKDDGFKFYRHTGGELRFQINAATQIFDYAWSPDVNTWYHVAVTRDGNDWYLFVDGVEVDTATDATAIKADEAVTLKIGSGFTTSSGPARWNSVADHHFNGWLDEVRIVKGEAMWTSSFTPAAAAYGSTVGGIYMTSSESNAPYISVFTHGGEPWSTITTRMRMGNLNGFLGYSSDLYGIAIGETNKFLKYDPTNGLRLQADEIKLLAGTDILMESGATPSTITWSGSSYSADMTIDQVGDNWFFDPETANTVGLNMGRSGTEWKFVTFWAKGNAQLISFYSTANNALVGAASSSTYAYANLVVEYSNDTVNLHHYWDASLHYFGVDTGSDNKKVDLGIAGRAYDDVYADDYNNEADFYHLDKYDDLATIKDIKASGEVDERTGFPLIDDNTIPEWLLVKHKNNGVKRDKGDENKVTKKWKKGEVERSDEGKPYLSNKTMISLLMGAIRQLDERIEALEGK